MNETFSNDTSLHEWLPLRLCSTCFLCRVFSVIRGSVWIFSRILRFQVSSKLAGRRQPGPRSASSSSSMVCLHPGAVTFSCVRSMNYLLSSHHSCTCMAFARLGGEFCQAQHLMLIVDK